MAAKINRTGKTYGDLTVLETILGSNSKTDTYLVKCNCCGNTMIIGIDALLKGLKCKNCRNKDRKSTYQDLIGKECNGIKVVSLAEDAIGRTGHRDIRYNCLCSCGKEFVAYRSSLLRGKVKSCGCRKHITEASKMLVDNAEAMQDYYKDKKCYVDWCKSQMNNDIWIKECLGTGFADVLYNLRCDIVHAGCANIADGGKRLFFSLGNHCSGLSFEQFRIIDVKQLCECLIGHAKSWCATSNMACIKNTYIFNSRDRDDKLLYDKLCADERTKQLKAESEKELMSSE